MLGLHVDSPAESSRLEGCCHLHCTDKGSKAENDDCLVQSYITDKPWRHLGWHWLPFTAYGVTLGHMRPPFMDYDGCGSSQILAYFPNYTTFLCKKYSYLMAASPNFWYWGGLCLESQTLVHVALRKAYSLNISPWALPPCWLQPVFPSGPVI